MLGAAAEAYEWARRCEAGFPDLSELPPLSTDAADLLRRLDFPLPARACWGVPAESGGGKVA